MKKLILIGAATVSLVTISLQANQVASRIIKNHGMDIAQAAVIYGLAHGISAEKARLNRPVGSLMSNKVFRVLSTLNLVRAVAQAVYHQVL